MVYPCHPCYTIDSLLSELPFKHSTDIILRRKGYASRQGSFGDIWECNLISGESSRLVRSIPGFPACADRGNQVAVKAVRICTNGDKDLKSHEKVTLESSSPGIMVNLPLVLETSKGIEGLGKLTTQEHRSIAWGRFWLWTLAEHGQPMVP